MSIATSFIGLPVKDIKLLKSLTGMLGVSRRLPVDIDIVDFNSYVQSKRIPELLFINRDYDKAMSLWKSISRSFPLTRAVFVTSHPLEIFDTSTTAYLQRPVSVKNLLKVYQTLYGSPAPAQVLEEAVEPEPVKTVEEVTVPGLNVLVVDDSALVRKYMEHILPQMVQESLCIDYASNGKDAVTMVQQSAYDLIFLDVVMPGIDGYKVCKYIKSKYNAYVVMLTGRKSAFDKVRGTMSGCDTYMVKPPKEREVQQILEACIFQSRLSPGNRNDELSYRYQ